MNRLICRFCRKDFLDDSNPKFCSKSCEDNSKKAVHTTISIKHVIKNRIIDIQSEIMKKIHRKISFNDLIDYILDILTIDKKFIDKIINKHYKY